MKNKYTELIEFMGLTDYTINDKFLERNYYYGGVRCRYRVYESPEEILYHFEINSSTKRTISLWSMKELDLAFTDGDDFPAIVKHFCTLLFRDGYDQMIEFERMNRVLDARAQTMNNFNIVSDFNVDITDLENDKLSINGFKINIHEDHEGYKLAVMEL